MSHLKKNCSPYVVIFVVAIHICFGLFDVLNGSVFIPLTTQMLSCSVSFTLIMSNKIANKNDRDWRYLITGMVIFCAAIISGSCCLYIIRITISRIELQILGDQRMNLPISDLYTDAKLVLFINADILCMVNGVFATVLWLNVEN